MGLFLYSALVVAIAVGTHTAQTMECPVVQGNSGVVDNIVENSYHLDILNSDQSQLTKGGKDCPGLKEIAQMLTERNDCRSLNTWQVSEIVSLSLLAFVVFCKWGSISTWIYTTCLNHRSKMTERKEKKLSVQREQMKAEIMQQVVPAPGLAQLGGAAPQPQIAVPIPAPAVPVPEIIVG